MVMENPISHTQTQTRTHSLTQCNILIVKAERTTKKKREQQQKSKRKSLKPTYINTYTNMIHTHRHTCTDLNTHKCRFYPANPYNQREF